MGRKFTQISILEIENKTFTICNNKIMLDSDLSELLGLPRSG